MIAVPTTAGTGSEVSRAAVITDQEARVKRVIFHPLMLPGVVISDHPIVEYMPLYKGSKGEVVTQLVARWVVA